MSSFTENWDVIKIQHQNMNDTYDGYKEPLESKCRHDRPTKLNDSLYNLKLVYQSNDHNFYTKHWLPRTKSNSDRKTDQLNFIMSKRLNKIQQVKSFGEKHFHDKLLKQFSTIFK